MNLRINQSRKSYVVESLYTFSPRKASVEFASKRYELQDELCPELVKATKATSSKKVVGPHVGEDLWELESEAKAYGV